MKTERRHELQTNELAIWLAKWVEQIKPYWKGIVGAAIMVLVVTCAVYLVNSRNAQGRSLAWTAFFDAFERGDREAYLDVDKSYPGTSAALWALQSAGDAALAAGAGELFRDRDAANEELEKARDAYRQVVDQVDAPGLSTEAKHMLKQRALFGLGQALEALGELTEAEQQYQAVIDEFPDAVATGPAQERLDSLKQQSTHDWYAWLAEQKPAASPITTPGLFDSLPDLPDNPDLNLPRPGQLLTPSGAAKPPSDGVPDGLDMDATSGDPSGLPLFGPDNAPDEGTPRLFDIPAETTDDSATGDETIDDSEAVEDPAGSAGQDTSLDEALGDEALGDEALGDEALGDEALGDEALGDEATGDEATGDEATGDEADR